MALIQITYRKGSPLDVKTLAIHDTELAVLKYFDLKVERPQECEADLLKYFEKYFRSKVGGGDVQSVLQKLVARGLLEYVRGPEGKMEYAPLIRTLVTFEKHTIVPPPKKEDSYVPPSRRWW